MTTDDIPSDPLGREIAMLLRDRPDCWLHISANLADMDDHTKAILLGDIKEMLGIKPEDLD